MENFEIQSLREIVKTGGPDVVKNFEEKFKEIRVEGKRKTFKDAVTNYTESPPKTYYTEAEQAEIEAMYMGKESLSRKRFSNSRDRNPSQNGRQRSLSQNRDDRQKNFSQYGNNNFRNDMNRGRSPGRRHENQYQDRARTPSRGRPYPKVRCIGCKCNSCYSNQKTLLEIKDLLSKKIDVKVVEQGSPTSVNLCEAQDITEDMVINYTYKDQGKQMMILDLGAPVSVAGIPWMKQYLAGFDLEIENLKGVPCNQPFVFGPSKRYISKLMVELPILVTRMDGNEDVLKVQTYLVDAEVPFLCGKQTLESWNFNIYGPDKTLEILPRSDGDHGKKFLKMIDTAGGHYAIVLEAGDKKKGNPFDDEDLGVLFMEDKKGELCSFKAVKKVHEVNRHKGRDQLIQAYRTAGWMGPELTSLIERVVNDCRVCLKFKTSIARP